MAHPIYDNETIDGMNRLTNALDVCKILVDSFEGCTEENLDAANFKDRSGMTWGAVELARKVLEVDVSPDF